MPHRLIINTSRCLSPYTEERASQCRAYCMEIVYRVLFAIRVKRSDGFLLMMLREKVVRQVFHNSQISSMTAERGRVHGLAMI